MQEQILEAYASLLTSGKVFTTDSWQSVENREPFLELLNLSLSMPIPDNKDLLEEQLKFMSKPWAENHFQERVSGEMMNPGSSYLTWPYYTKRKIEDQFKDEELFSHTYMERMNTIPFTGIRFQAGNLQSVVKLLQDHPTTRQAYLPIFFPEDTGCVHGKRIPCTLGYQFMVRGGKMHVWYFARSIDAIYHFEDDVYLASRLCHWMIWRTGLQVNPGNLNFHISNFHCFEKVKHELNRRYNEYI